MKKTNQFSYTSVTVIAVILFLLLISAVRVVDITYVDRGYVSRPFRPESVHQTISEAINAAMPGGVIQINSENRRILCDSSDYRSIQESTFYPEILTINKPLTIKAGSGMVRIGECVQRPAAGQLIRPEDADTIVSTKAALKSAIDNATSGDIIYIEDGAEINVTGTYFTLKAGVTLASGRGRGLKKGALLYSTEKRKSWSLFTLQSYELNSGHTRITGIRFQGPSTEDGADKYAKCIDIYDKDAEYYPDGTVEIDNNEFYGWPIAAVAVSRFPLDKCSLGSVHIHDNYFHHNLGNGLGYGVSIGEAYALIEKNVFDQNRHAIAGSGICHTGYEARWNVVLSKNDARSHSFDMHRHGESDSWGLGPAGEYIMIRENTFLYGRRVGVKIRGRPTEGAFVIDNAFIHSKSEIPPPWQWPFPWEWPWEWLRAVRQTGESGNLVVRNNEYEVDYRNQLAFGDFDGDGATDVFWADGRNWWYAGGGQRIWKHLNSYPNTLSELSFQDIDGNGKTDVYRSADGKQWVSWNGTGAWQEISGSSLRRRALATGGDDKRYAGDFDGNGITDVFMVNPDDPTEWLISWDGKSEWQKLNPDFDDVP